MVEKSKLFGLKDICMKVKIEIVKNILIYILSLITVVVLMLLFNQRVILPTNQNVLDNSQSILKFCTNSNECSLSPRTKAMIKKIEGIVFVIIAIVGFVIIVMNTFKKFKMLTEVINKNLENIDKLEFNKQIYKYDELNDVTNKVNKLIKSIQAEQDANIKLYEDIIHDFSTPLHIISGHLELSKIGIELDQKVIETQVNRLVHLAKYNNNKRETTYQIVKGSEILEYFEVIKLINSEVKFTFNIDDKVSWMTKKENLYRVIDNLVNNAIKHGKPGMIAVSLREDRENIYFEIANDGTGISIEEQKLIFKRKHSQVSTGLGLDIVRQIIDDLGYEIKLDSSNEETRFEIIIKKIKNS